MISDCLNRRSLLCLAFLAALAPAVAAQSAGSKPATYFPPAGTWQHKAPAEVGMDAARLKEAVEWAEAHPSKWDFEKDQVRTFGKVLGALPAQRAERKPQPDFFRTHHDAARQQPVQSHRRKHQGYAREARGQRH